MKSNPRNPPWRTVALVVCLLWLVTPGIGQAQPLGIFASNAQYTVYVEARSYPDYTNDVTRTTVLASPISDELEFPFDPDNYPGVTNYAIASAGLFTVSDHTGHGFANASATSQLWFSPFADQTQTIGISIYAFGANGGHMFSMGNVTLFDLSSDTEVWNYGWDYINPAADNIPWDDQGITADLALDTSFFASHQYELSLMTYSNAADDTEDVSIQLTGLQVVPEPSGIRLFLMSLLGLPMVRRKGKGQSRL
jgi:hypothetical protein